MAFRRTALLLAFAVFLAGVVPAHAGGNIAWTSTGGPAGGFINALVAPLNIPGALLAATNGGIYLSRDGGAHWQPSVAGLGDPYVSTLATSADATLIYAGTRSGIYRSRDGGARWSSSDPRLVDQLISSLLIDANNPLYAYAGTATSIYKTENGGENWTEIGQSLRPVQVWSLVLAHDSTALYAVTDSGVYATPDRGTHWTKSIDVLPDGARAQALLVTERGFFAATAQGLYRSKDGKSWTFPSGVISGALVRPIAVDARDSGRMFAVTARGLAKSSDGGQNWTLLPNAPTDSAVVTLSVGQKGLVYLGAARGVWRTEDDGANWHVANSGIAGSTINALLLASSTPDTLLAATRFGLWYSHDRGASWLESTRVTDSNVLSLVADPIAGRVIYAGTYTGAVLQSKDGGQSFSRLAAYVGNKAPVASLAVVHPSANATILVAGTLGDGVYRSDDEGKTWVAQSSGLGGTPRVNVIALSTPTTLLAGTDHGLYRLDLTTASATFIPASPSLPLEPVLSILIGSREPKTLIVLYTTGLHKSGDGGETWNPAGQGALDSRMHFRTLAATESLDAVYLGTDRGVYRSLDIGNSWTLLGDGLQLGADVQSIAVDLRSPSRLFVGTSANGVLAGSDSMSSGDDIPWSELGVSALLIVLAAILGITILKRAPHPARNGWVTSPRQDSLADSSIAHVLKTYGEANSEHLPSFSRDALGRALVQYMERHSDDALTLNRSATKLQLDNFTAAHEFFGDWDVACEAVNDSESFAAITSEMVEQLCSLLGFARVDEREFKGLIGYVVRAPTLRLKLPSRFPIIFVPPDRDTDETIAALRDLMSVLDLAGYFALLVDLHNSSEMAQRRTLKQLARQAIHDFIVLDDEDVSRLYSARDPVRRLVDQILEQVDLSVISPYVTSGPVPDNMFFGREHELKTILRTIRYNNFAIVGGRKIGKTSLLARVYRLLLESSEFHPLYLDCQAIHTDADLYEAIDALWQTPLPSATPEGLRRMILGIQDQHPNRCVVLLFDEIDALLQYDVANGERIFHILRALSQEKQVHCIFCGEKQLNIAAQDPRLVFFNFCTTLPLSYLMPAEAQRVVTEPMQDMGIALEGGTELADRIARESAGHPNIIQYVCQKLIERINTRQVTSISRADLDAVIASAEYNEYVTSIVWGNADALERLITLLMLDAHQVTLSKMADLLRERRVVVTPTQLQNALDALCLASILRRDGPKYTIANDKFARALKRSQDIHGLTTVLSRGINTEDVRVHEER